MKIIIAGSRRITDYKTVSSVIFQGLWNWRKTYEDIDEVISGGAIGVDNLGELWARRK